MPDQWNAYIIELSVHRVCVEETRKELLLEYRLVDNVT